MSLKLFYLFAFEGSEGALELEDRSLTSLNNIGELVKLNKVQSQGFGLNFDHGLELFLT